MKTKKVLVQFNSGEAEGFNIVTQQRYYEMQGIVADFFSNSAADGVEFYYGKHEYMYFHSEEDFYSNIRKFDITEEEEETLNKFFPYGVGSMTMSMAVDIMEDTIDEWRYDAQKNGDDGDEDREISNDEFDLVGINCGACEGDERGVYVEFGEGYVRCSLCLHEEERYQKWD